MTNKITFKKATTSYKEIIFLWLAEPHVQEFWNNTQGHKDDILNFMDGRKTPSNYCDGKDCIRFRQALRNANDNMQDNQE